MIKVRHPIAHDRHHAIVKHMVELINQVYEDGEKGMWRPGAQRIDNEAFKQLLTADALLLAELDKQLVGCISIGLVNANVARFSMLVVDPSCRGMGIGYALINAAEQWAREQACRIMSFGLLTPQHWTPPSKAFLQEWYPNFGYHIKYKENFSKESPNRSQYLVEPCDFTIYYKNL